MKWTHREGCRIYINNCICASSSVTEVAACCCCCCQELGVNAVELLPVFEYDEMEFQRSQNPRDHMVNVWGYSHMSFMAPMSR